MALAADPDLVVLDEPTAGMDVETRRDFWAGLRAEAARGRTVLFATHYLDEADAFADRIVMLRSARDGGTVADLAAELHLSEGTVRNHLSAAIGKTGARTRAEAVRLAEERGWLLG